MVGDAAHLMPPAGGLGLNTAIQDGHNLAWKVALVLEDKASTSLLESYQSERWPVAQAVVGQAVADLTAPTPDYLPVSAEVKANTEISTATGSDWAESGGWEQQDPQTALLEQLRLIVGYRYRSKGIIAEVEDGTKAEAKNPEQALQFKLSGVPGTRAPHLWLKRGDECLSTLDLLEYNWVLLVGSEGQDWLEAGEELNRQSFLGLKVYQIGGESELSEIALGSWEAAYEVGPTGAVLVRPDQFIAWRMVRRAEHPSAYTVLAGVIEQLLGKAEVGR